jgi:hypothetical protein
VTAMPATRWAGAAMLGVLAGIAPGVRAQTAADSALARALVTPDTVAMRAHTRFLANDVLRGRAPGTPGADAAAAFIAAQFEALGLAPAGADGGYYQPVPLLGVTPHPSLIVGARRQTAALQYGREFVAWPIAPEASTIVDGDLVFVGYGIRAPEWEWDDFRDQPLTGQILLIWSADPWSADTARFDSRRAAHYGHWSHKLEQAARMGATGILLVHSEERVGYPWDAVVNSRTGELLFEDRQRTTSLRFAAWVSEPAARNLIEGTGRDFDLLMRRAESPDFSPIPLDAHVVMRMQSDLRPVEAANVVALRPGTAEAPEEAVVFTAHYDHLGVGRPLGPDSVYNGAEDAAGVAALFEVAAAFASVDAPLRRSIVFLATTGAEAGGMGAAAFLRDPAVALEHTAAVVGFDRANVLGAADDAVALGSEWSSLREDFTRAAEAEGLGVAPYPPADFLAFHRSDARAFSEAGVPAFLLRAGGVYRGRSPDWGMLEARRYLATRYHQPSDEIRSDFRWDGILQQVRLAIRVGWGLATTDAFPTWNRDARFRGVGERLRLMRLRGGGM